jgi:hypothetical protein
LSNEPKQVRSRYRNIPTVNEKFEKFIDLILASKMSKEDLRDEIVNYV